MAALLNEIIARGGTTAFETAFTAQAMADALLTGPTILCCFVAQDDDGSLHAFQTLMRSSALPDDIGDIATFARVDHTQKGIGTRLFAQTRTEAARQGLSAINATIRADNAGGLSFYSRVGFIDHDVVRAAPLADGTPVDRIGKRYPLT
ncbi:GNAT family N-acetyltransferase [Sphingomonas sp. PAMC 26621]|uniref:GNAT family N-acetyltransferase n=1 Tax=Sphingomonas sp. PAMC 26621 TaxID=1112213 RepID=UPI0002889A20|nr:GNAT family N-acetyltransferase [Sphingomonas sp. PAMC 26621]